MSVMLTVIKDPFNPYDSQVVDHVEWKGKTVEAYIEEIYGTGIFPEFEVVANINGLFVELDKQNSMIPIDGSNLVLCLAPAGDNLMIRMVAMIIIMVVATYLTGPGGALASQYAWVNAATVAIITTAGGLIMNAIWPIEADMPDSSDSSTSYGWGLTNTEIEGNAWPVIYGKTKVVPYLIGKYVTNVDDKQYLNQLFALADNEVNVIDEIKINKNDLADYTDVQTVKRYGTVGQTVIPAFNSTHTIVTDARKFVISYQTIDYGATQRYTDNLLLPAVLNWMEATVPGTVNDQIGFGIVLPRGLTRYDTESGLVASTVWIYAQYRAVGASTWINWLGDGTHYVAPGGHGEYLIGDYTGTKIYRDTTSAIRKSWTKNVSKSAIGPDEYEIRVAVVMPYFSLARQRILVGYDESDDRRRPIYEFFNYPYAYKGKRRDITNDTYLDYTEGIVEDDFEYPGTALLAVTSLASEQLSGSLPTVSCVVTRSYVSVYTGSSWANKPSNNPAWACYDMLVNNNYGGGVPYGRMNYSEFAAWAAFCEINSYECNIVMDVTLSFPDALSRISSLGRGRIVQRGTNFGVIIDQEDTPVQLFGVGNIIEGSMEHAYIGKVDRVNAIAVSYFDENHDYDEKKFELRSSNYDTDSEVDINKVDLTLYGCVSKAQALKQAKYLLNCNQYLVDLVKFEVSVDALAATTGQVIYVSHDVPQWGYSGHVLAGSTSSTLKLDREVTMLYGVTYHVMVRHFADDRIEEVAIDPVKIGNSPYTTDELEIVGTWSSETPSAEDVYAFGEINKVSKEFRITSITRSQEMRRMITALEYRSEVYSDSVSIPDYGDESALEPYVDDLRAEEVYRYENGVGIGYVTLSWRGFGFHNLFMKEESEDVWRKLAALAGKNSYEVTTGLVAGKTYYFAVSSTDNPGDGELVVLTFNGWSIPQIIWPVTGLEIIGNRNSSIWQNRDLKLRWNLSTSMNVPAGEEILGAGTYPPMTQFGGYRIQILNTDGTIRREVYQIDNTFIYSYEMNDEDGTPNPNILVKVWAQDIYGQLSDEPATMSTSNPAPAAVSGLTATPWMGGIKFEWIHNTEIDFAKYSYRLQVADDEWSDWTDLWNNNIQRMLTEAEKEAHGSDPMIYIEIKAYDTFGSASIVQDISAAVGSLNIQHADMDDFAIKASNIFTKIPIIDGDTWTDDTPDTNSVTWNAHTLYYNGVAYPIAGDNTDKKYIYWINGASSYSSSDTHPGDGVPLEKDDFIIATNINGTTSLAWNAIANQVIGSAYIQDLAVDTAHINFLAVGNAQINDMEGDKILLTSNLSIGSATWAIRGIQLQYNAGFPRFHVGDGANDFFKFDGTNVTISLSKVGSALTLKAGADLTLEGSTTNPALIVFQGASYDMEMGIERTSVDKVFLSPSTDNQCSLLLGANYGFTKMVNSNILYSREDASIYSNNNPTDHARVRCLADGTNQYITLQVKDNNNYGIVRLYSDRFLPLSGDKDLDLGEDGNAWDDVYGKNFYADVDYHLYDDFDDIALIKDMVPKLDEFGQEIISETTGRPKLNISHLPDEFTNIKKLAKNISYESGTVVTIQDIRDIGSGAKDPIIYHVEDDKGIIEERTFDKTEAERRTFARMGGMEDLSRGAIKQLDTKIETLMQRIDTLEKI